MALLACSGVNVTQFSRAPSLVRAGRIWRRGIDQRRWLSRLLRTCAAMVFFSTCVVPPAIDETITSRKHRSGGKP